MKQYISHRSQMLRRVPSRAVGDYGAELSRKGKDILHLLGWPHLALPEHIIAAATEAAGSLVHPHSSGIPELKVALAGKLRAENSVHLTRPQEQLIITNGGFHALHVCLISLLDPGDEVLLFSPTFFFDGLIEIVGGVPRYAKLDRADGFRLQPAALNAAITKRTKVILLNTPLNPTGHVATLAELQEILKVAVENDLIVISDESYERLVYDGLKHHCIGALPGAQDRVITVQSFTKTYAMPQWRVGYIACPVRFYARLLEVLEWMVLSCNYVAQRCALAAVTGPADWWQGIAKDFERKRDVAYAGVSTIAGIQCVKPQGSPFIFPRVRDLGVSGSEFARYALENHGIPAVAGAAFQDDDHVRIPFGADDDVLRELASRLDTAAKEIKGARFDAKGIPSRRAAHP